MNNSKNGHFVPIGYSAGGLGYSNPQLAMILATSEQLGLSQPSVVEKDSHVTRALHALSDCENEYFKLVFQGGTCLAKAHKIIKRMSEDCDFRIISLEKCKGLSKKDLSEQVTAFKSDILNKLKNAGFEIKSDYIKSDNKFIKITLNYQSILPRADSIRSDILLEFIFIEAQLETKPFPITTLVKETLGDVVDHPSKLINCVSVEETLAEKFVALLRKVSNIEHGAEHDDKLIRHLYDINKIIQNITINDEFISLIKKIVETERYRAKKGEGKDENKFYYENPIAEMKRSIETLKMKEQWSIAWDILSNSLVFDSEKVEFKNAIENFCNFSNILFNNIYVIFFNPETDLQIKSYVKNLHTYHKIVEEVEKSRWDNKPSQKLLDKAKTSNGHLKKIVKDITTIPEIMSELNSTSIIQEALNFKHISDIYKHMQKNKISSDIRKAVLSDLKYRANADAV